MDSTARPRAASARTGAAIAALWLIAALPAAAQQPLTLGEAFRRADEGAYANRIGAGEAAAQAGDGLRAFRGILPTVRVESGYARTTDPIGVFGTTLRQRSITAADFDPAQLNNPSATANWTGGVVLEQPLVNVDAWLGRRAATHATSARESAARWTVLSTRVDVVRAYYGGVLAVERVTTLESAYAAARGHVRQAEKMVEQGIVTKSDALLAGVRAGEVETQLIEARGDTSLVKRQIALLLGAPGDVSFTLPAALPSSEHVLALSAIGDVSERNTADARADVRAAAAAHAAAQSDVRRARSAWLPRLNAQARYDWNSPDVPYGGRENWSVGIAASWTPLAGAAQLGDLRASEGRAQSARAQAEAARAQAELDAVARENAWRVAVERLRIADQAVEQSVEAHRIVARKYEGGLATVVELLGASAAETEARLRRSAARYDAIVRAAERLQGAGQDPALLAGWAQS